MIQVNAALLWGLVELVALLLIVLVIMLIVGFLRKQRDKKAAQALVAALKENADGRSKQLSKVFEGRYGYNGNALKKVVRDLSKRELLFYQHLLNIYLKRSPEQLAQIHLTLEETVSPYLTLTLPEGTADAPVEDSGELERLKRENFELSEELRVTMETVGRMLDEYSTLFSPTAKPAEAAAPSIPEEDAALLDAMEPELFS